MRRCVDAVARQRGYDVIVTNTDYAQDRLASGINTILGRRVAGFALVISETVAPIIPAPIISTGRVAVDHSSTPTRDRGTGTVAGRGRHLLPSWAVVIPDAAFAQRRQMARGNPLRVTPAILHAPTKLGCTAEGLVCSGMRSRERQHAEHCCQARRTHPDSGDSHTARRGHRYSKCVVCLVWYVAP